MDRAKIDQNTDLTKFPSAKCFWFFCECYHLRIEVLQNSSALFCVSFSFESKSERVERRKEAQNPGPSFPTSFHKIRQFQVSIEITAYILGQ